MAHSWLYTDQPIITLNANVHLTAGVGVLIGCWQGCTYRQVGQGKHRSTDNNLTELKKQHILINLNKLKDKYFYCLHGPLAILYALANIFR